MRPCLETMEKTALRFRDNGLFNFRFDDTLGSLPSQQNFQSRLLRPLDTQKNFCIFLNSYEVIVYGGCRCVPNLSPQSS